MQPYGVGEPRIIGGEPATRGQFPHQASVLIGGLALCGGSLISKTWVLTAGHCVNKAKTWSITLGATDRKADEPGRIILTANKGILHENYNRTSINNDIGVIQLPQDVEFSGESFTSSMRFFTSPNAF